jgi:hypothetical protein
MVEWIRNTVWRSPKFTGLTVQVQALFASRNFIFSEPFQTSYDIEVLPVQYSARMNWTWVIDVTNRPLMDGFLLDIQTADVKVYL